MRGQPQLPSEAPGPGNRKPRSASMTRHLGPHCEFPGSPHTPACHFGAAEGKGRSCLASCRVSFPPTWEFSAAEQTGVLPPSPLPSSLTLSVSKTRLGSLQGSQGLLTSLQLSPRVLLMHYFWECQVAPPL